MGITSVVFAIDKFVVRPADRAATAGHNDSVDSLFFRGVENRRDSLDSRVHHLNLRPWRIPRVRVGHVDNCLATFDQFSPAVFILKIALFDLKPVRNIRIRETLQMVPPITVALIMDNSFHPIASF
jgi:hypothetical protein